VIDPRDAGWSAGIDDRRRAALPRALHTPPRRVNVGQVEFFEVESPEPLAIETSSARRAARKLWPELGESYAGIDWHLDDARWVGYRLAEILPLTPQSRQFCLELESASERLQLLQDVLNPSQRAGE
jgi:Lon protease-like protein